MSRCYIWWKTSREILPLLYQIDEELVKFQYFSREERGVKIHFGGRSENFKKNSLATYSNPKAIQLSPGDLKNASIISCRYLQGDVKKDSKRKILILIDRSLNNFEHNINRDSKINKICISLIDCRLYWRQDPKYDGMLALTEFYHICRELMFSLGADRAACRTVSIKLPEEWEGEGIEDEEKMIKYADFMFQPQGRQVVNQRLEDGVEILKDFWERNKPVEIFIKNDEVNWFRAGGLRSPHLTDAQLEENNKLLYNYFNDT